MAIAHRNKYASAPRRLRRVLDDHGHELLPANDQRVVCGRCRQPLTWDGTAWVHLYVSSHSPEPEGGATLP